MHKRLTCFIALIMLVSGAAAESEKLRQRWVENCPKVKERFASGAGMNVVFSERDAVESGSEPYWSLTTYGVSAPVPPLQYQTLMITPDNSSGGKRPFDSLMLGTGDNHMMFVHFPHGFKPRKDFFAKAEFPSGEVTSSREGISMTRMVWGGPVGQADIIEQGFMAKPADLTCKGDNFKEELRLAMAFPLKTIGPGKLSGAYRIPRAEPSGILTRYQQEETVLWQALFPPDEGRDRATQIEMKLPLDSPYRSSGMGIGAGKTFPTQTNPSWLQQLNRALSRMDVQSWRKLHDEMENAGFTGKSLDSVQNYMDVQFSSN